MKATTYYFSSADCTVYTGSSIAALADIVPGRCIIVTDENILAAHRALLSNWPCIVLPAGEQHKQQATVDSIIQQLMTLKADRATTLVGVGGGVITDITGYAASVYMRGIRCGFVPTSILGMVDAAIGGKNGVDVGLYKNLVGTIRQPNFLLYDVQLLNTLPKAEWINGFAEIIKHACIKDADLFALLAQHRIEDFMQESTLLQDLIERNIAIKAAVVAVDETEQGERKLLNFGHTIGHAIENIHSLPHGHAVSIGMAAACKLSEELTDFSSAQKEQVIEVLQQYQLPVQLKFDTQQVADMVLLDKKRSNATIHFILLESIGKAKVQPIGMEQFTDLLNQLF